MGVSDHLQGNQWVTPFLLAYKVEAIVPLEITHISTRVEAFEPEANEEGMRIALDLIDEVKNEANTKIVGYQKVNILILQSKS